jgi:hypothetical protein
VKAWLPRSLLAGLLATAIFGGLNLALGNFSIFKTVVYGVVFTLLFGLWLRSRSSGNRSAKPS